MDIWDRFGDLVRQLVDETEPPDGARTVEWDGADDTGRALASGSFIVRVTADGRSESQIVQVAG